MVRGKLVSSDSRPAKRPLELPLRQTHSRARTGRRALKRHADNNPLLTKKAEACGKMQEKYLKVKNRIQLTSEQKNKLKRLSEQLESLEDKLFDRSQQLQQERDLRARLDDGTVNFLVL